VSAEPDPAKAPPGLGETSRPRWVKAWFRAQNQRTSFCTVAATLISLAVAGALGLWNIRSQIGRPELEPISAYLSLVKEPTRLPRDSIIPIRIPGWNGTVSWQSVGKRSPRDLFLTVYAVEKDGRRQSKLWAGPAGPNYGTLHTDFHLGVLDNLPDHLLICPRLR
jgi:hypothetical protein